jgi:predicted nucleic acid-binding protein
MKRRVFVDTNIALDYLTQRKPFNKPASELFSLVDRGYIIIYISSLSFMTIHYHLLGLMEKREALRVVRDFRIGVTLLPVSGRTIDMALASDFKDFEDAVQYHCAKLENMSVLLTRNVKDYVTAKIPVMTIEDFLKIEKKRL